MTHDTQVRTYLAIFAALAALTVVTVAVSYLHLSITSALAVAMLVASVKAGLVILYFMHLKGERPAITWSLGLTAVLLFLLLWLPWWSEADRIAGTVAQ